MITKNQRCPSCGLPHTIEERIRGYVGKCVGCKMKESHDRGVCYWTGNKLNKERRGE